MNHFKKSNPEKLKQNWHDFKIRGRVVVLYGGETEREVSLESGREVLTSLKKREKTEPELEVIGFDLNPQNPIKNLIALKPDLVFIALHGGDGEDGTIQGFLQSLLIPHTGSSVLASALAMDKQVSKQIWLSHHLPCPDYTLISDDDISNDIESLADRVIEKLGLPFVIKPIASGSSLGVSLVRERSQIKLAFDAAKKHSKAHAMVMAERYIKGKEMTVGFLFDEALEVIAIEVENPFYDYDAKYISNQTRLVCPAPIASDLRQTIQKIAIKAYQSLKMSGWGRVDLIIDENGNPFLLEANVVPGLTSHSLVPCAARTQKIDFDELVLRILKTAATPR